MKNKEKLPNWDLSSLYKNNNDPQIEKDLEYLKSQIKNFCIKFKGKITKLEAEQLANALNKYEEINEIIGKLSSYAYLQYSTNISDNKKSLFYQNISEKINELSTHLIFFSLELNQLLDTDLTKKLSQNSKLSYYAPWLRDVRVFKPHQLDENIEKLFHERNLTARNNWSRLFDETIADMRFILGKKSLTATEIFNILSDKDATKRKKAAIVIGKTLEQNGKIFTLITNTLAKDKAIEDQWRNFHKPISSRNLSNLIEDEVTDSLIKTVKDNYAQLSHRYYKLKAKWFGKKHLDFWDRNAPLPKQKEKYISFNEAKELVTDTYQQFSPVMGKITTEFFNKKWIDAAVNPGKDSGAFSHPTVPSANPFILLNYKGKSRDVMTLAHELGHGIHQVLAAKQGALMCDTPLTLAETASVFGEQLTFRSLVKNAPNEQQKKFLIANKVEDMLNTVVRQVAFCEFERIVHDARKEGELSAEQICQIWLKVQKDSLGSGIKISQDYKYYWSYIPHFIHSPFYVYAYAFGDCLVNSLYQLYQQRPKGFQDKYITMLEAGGTLRHKELLAPFNLDATDPTFWQMGINTIIELIDQLD